MVSDDDVIDLTPILKEIDEIVDRLNKMKTHIRDEINIDRCQKVKIGRFTLTKSKTVNADTSNKTRKRRRSRR